MYFSLISEPTEDGGNVHLVNVPKENMTRNNTLFPKNKATSTGALVEVFTLLPVIFSFSCTELLFGAQIEKSTSLWRNTLPYLNNGTNYTQRGEKCGALIHLQL